MNCIPCFEQQKKINQQMKKALQEATIYAKEISQAVIVFPTQEGFEFQSERDYKGDVYTHKVYP